MELDTINAALQTGKGISEFGLMVMTTGFFLVLSALVWLAFFRLGTKLINNVMTSQKDMLKELNEQMAENNCSMTRIAEGLMPETQMRVKAISNTAFDLSVEKVCRIIKKVRMENHIADKESTGRKIRVLLTNLHEDRNSKFDCFTYRGRKLSAYTSTAWIEQVAKVIESEIYNDAGENNGRAYTNVESAYANIRLEFYHNLNK